MDLFLLLRSQHEVITTLLDLLARGPPHGIQRRQTLLRRLAQTIDLNSTIEQRVLTAVLRKSEEPRPLHVALFACLERHRVMSSLLLPDVFFADPQSPLFEGRLLVLSETAQALFKLEASDIFPRIAGTFSTDELKAFVTQIDVVALAHFKHS